MGLFPKFQIYSYLIGTSQQELTDSASKLIDEFLREQSVLLIRRGGDRADVFSGPKGKGFIESVSAHSLVRRGIAVQVADKGGAVGRVVVHYRPEMSAHLVLEVFPNDRVKWRSRKAQNLGGLGTNSVYMGAILIKGRKPSLYLTLKVARLAHTFQSRFEADTPDNSLFSLLDDAFGKPSEVHRIHRTFSKFENKCDAELLDRFGRAPLQEMLRTYGISLDVWLRQ